MDALSLSYYLLEAWPLWGKVFVICRYRDTIGQHMNASASFYRRDLMYMRPKFVSLDASVKATRDVNPLTYQTLLLLVVFVFVLYLVSIPSVSIHLY